MATTHDVGAACWSCSGFSLPSPFIYSSGHNKPHLHARIGDKYMNNSLICYVEKEEMLKVTNEIVVCCFMKMQGRRFDDED